MSNVANSQAQDKGMTSNMLDPQIIAFSPSLTREDHYASLNLSELKLCSSHEEPNFSPATSESKTESRILSSSPLDELSLTEPLSPKWTSTMRNFPHSYTSQTSTSQKANTRPSRQERPSLLNTGISLNNDKSYYSSEPKQMSHYQTTYWACAIPRNVPPTPDRKSPSWDPDKEYQTLLDYTYPLRPNMSNTSNEHRLQTDQLFQDSGIEVDSFVSSSNLSFLDQPASAMRQGRSGPTSSQTFGFQSLNMRKQAHSADIMVSRSLNSSLDQVGLSLESLDCEVKDSFHYKKFGIFSKSKSAPTFIRSTSILPHSGSLGELDEEFLQLPEQLQEIQDLSQKLKDITAQISQPVTISLESSQKESDSVRSSSGQLKKQAAEVSVRGISSAQPCTEQMKGVDSKVQVISHQVTRDSLRHVEAIVDQLSGTSVYDFKRRTETNEGVDESQESLLHYLEVSLDFLFY